MKLLSVLCKYDYGIKERGLIQENNLLLSALGKNTSQLVSFWIDENGYPDDASGLQKKLISFADENKPDVIYFILMSNEISIETLKYLSSKYVTVNWFCDDQWRFDSFTKHIAPLLTYSVTVDKYCLEKYKKIGYRNVILGQWGTYHLINEKRLNDKNYKYCVSFIGQYNETRAWMIEELKMRGVNVECFGYGWPNGKVTLEEMSEIYISSKINLNLSNSYSYDVRFLKYLIAKNYIGANESVLRKIIKKILMNSFYKYKVIYNYLFADLVHDKNVEQIKARNYEIPASGGFQLSNYVIALEEYYIIGQEIAVYTNLDDLVLQIDFFLNNDTEREKIKKNGYKRTAEYRYEKIFKSVFKNIKAYK